jgi:hypothetical protein
VVAAPALRLHTASTLGIIPLINGDAQKATTGGRGRDRDFLTCDPGDLFINDQNEFLL